MYLQPASVPWISSYGSLLVIALVACWAYARRLTPAYQIDRSHVDLAVPVVFLLSVFGARLLAAVLLDDAGVGSSFHASHVRFRLFGLLLFAAPALFIYARLSSQSFRVLADLFALPAVLWLATLRIGCFLAGCCWGDIVAAPNGVSPTVAAPVLTLPWLSADWIPGVSFPAGSYAFEQHLALGLISPGATTSLPVHPTQLYEALLLLLMLAGLRAMSSGKRAIGKLALQTLGGYACLRFLLEFIRADSLAVIGPLTATQVICLALLALVLLTGRQGRSSSPRIRTSS